MDKRTFYSRPDGGISVICPAPAFIAKMMADGKTEDEAMDEVESRSLPEDAANVGRVMVFDLPPRTFRDAWTHAAGAVSVDMPKARAIHMGRIREARDKHPDWPKIDTDRARAVENNDSVLMASAKKRANELRDLPAVVQSKIKAAKTPELLNAVWPDILPPR